MRLLALAGTVLAVAAYPKVVLKVPFTASAATRTWTGQVATTAVRKASTLVAVQKVAPNRALVAITLTATASRAANVLVQVTPLRATAQRRRIELAAGTASHSVIVELKIKEPLCGVELWIVDDGTKAAIAHRKIGAALLDPDGC